MASETARDRRRREAMEQIVAADAIEDFADDVADDLRRADREIAQLRKSLEAAEELLGQWMFWASGVAFKSELGEELVAATDKLLAAAPPETGRGK